MKLISERLYFRKLSDADASETYASWLNDPIVNQYLETRHTAHTVNSCKQFIHEMNESKNDYLFGIFLLDTDQHIGNIKLGFINWTYQSAQISLFIGERSAWGSGLATEAIKKISHFGFEKLSLQKIEAGCYENNLGSLHAFKNAGYQIEGVLREHVTVNEKRIGCFYLGLLKGELHYA